MLKARRRSDRKIVEAYFERKENGPFACLVCNEEVVLRSGDNRVDHFAHANPLACEYAQGESDLHRKCKREIYEALSRESGVKNLFLELPLGTVRPDVSAEINGTPVAIEVQISSLSIETIMRRTIDYHQRGIYVLWLLPWTAELDNERYAPALWEKWIHACYFGRVYYWLQGLEVAEYTFDPSFQIVPKTTWYADGGRKMSAGGYAARSVRFKTPVRGRTLNIARDFGPRKRFWWRSGRIKVPDAKLFCHRRRSFGQRP
jgi:competence protein CoiA